MVGVRVSGIAGPAGGVWGGVSEVTRAGAGSAVQGGGGGWRKGHALLVGSMHSGNEAGSWEHRQKDTLTSFTFSWGTPYLERDRSEGGSWEGGGGGGG